MDRAKYRKQAETLVAQMTVEEVVSQMLHHAPAIERLGIPEYNWWNEGLHGVGRAGIATVFPQAIGMAAMFDVDFMRTEAEIIAQEARAKYNAAVAEGDRDIYKGLTYWSPNINIFRDPRWGRGHETYGEDPKLTAELGKAFIQGLQGDGETMKIAACAKHFAVHSGPESLRHAFDAQVSEKDLRETYLPAFETAVVDARVESVMGAYNRTNGEPCCGSQRLLVDILRGEWKFQGHVLSDCWAVKDFHEHHRVTNCGEESASLAVRMGCDLNCGCTYDKLLHALEKGLIKEEELRESIIRLFTTRYALGMFDKECAYNAIPYTEVHQPAYKNKALEAARKSMVLLKNDGILPLSRDSISSIGVIGPNAYSQAALYGNYHGDSDEWITNLDGIRQVAGDDIRIFYSAGAHLYQLADDGLAKPGRLHSEAIAVAKASDIVVLCVGLDETLEGEEGDEGNQHASGDKQDLLLPESQRLLCDKVLSLGKPTIVVINSGSALDLSMYENRVNAIVQAWYSGEQGGRALAQILFGDVNPSGKLPITFYYNDQPIPEFTDYHMAGRTYRFIQDSPWYPFGYGLSYSTVYYSKVCVTASKQGLCVHFDVNNTSDREVEEIAEIYLRYEGEGYELPHHKLVAYQRQMIPNKRSQTYRVEISARELETVLESGQKKLLDGKYTLFVGGCQPDPRSIELTGSTPMAVSLCVAQGRIEVVA